MHRLLSAFAVVAVTSSLSWADTVLKPYELLYVSSDQKLYGELVYGEVMIHVATESKDEALATADVVAQQLIDNDTFDAVQVFAFTPRRTRPDANGFTSEKNGTAWVSYSSDPRFMPEAADWRYEIVENSFIVTTEFDASEWVVPAGFPDASREVRQICRDLSRCSAGTDPR